MTATAEQVELRSPGDVLPVSGDVKLVHVTPNHRHVYPVPLILVPSLLSRYYVLDLHPQRSMAAFLRNHGFDVYLIDWGDPPGRVGPDFDTYVDDYLAGAVEMAAEASESGRASVLGYSLGGVLSTIYAALHPDYIQNLITLTTPIDTSRTGLVHTWSKTFPVEAFIGVWGNVPAWWLTSGFLSMAIPRFPDFWRAFGEDLKDPKVRPVMKELGHWIKDGVAVAGGLYKTLVRDCYRHNRLLRGDLVVGGREVDLANIRASLLTIAAGRDHLCPPEAAYALNLAVSSVDETSVMVPGGHLGAVVGRMAEHILWTRLVDWLGSRSGHAPEED